MSNKNQDYARYFDGDDWEKGWLTDSAIDVTCQHNIIEPHNDNIKFCSVDYLEFPSVKNGQVFKKIENKELIFFPYNNSSKHYSLFVYEKATKTIHHYNSIEGYDNRFNDYKSVFTTFFSRAGVTSSELDFEDEKTPQQGNTIDCGVFVIMITRLLVDRYKDGKTGDQLWKIESEDDFLFSRYKERLALTGEIDLSNELPNKNNKANNDKEKVEDSSNNNHYQQIITEARGILQKDGPKREELEQAIEKLKKLSLSVNGSAEKTFWEKNKETNQQLLNSLQSKLDKLTASDREETPIQDENKKNLREDIEKAKKGTDEDKVNAIKNAGQTKGDKSLEEEQEEIKQMKSNLAKNNPAKYREAIIGEIDENMKKNNLSGQELDEETQKKLQKIKNGEIEDKVVENIHKNIGEVGAKKKFENLSDKVKKLPKFCEHQIIKRIEEELLWFINQPNTYYEPYKAQTRALLVELQNKKLTTNNNNNDKLPKKYWIIGGSLILLAGIAIVFLSKRVRKARR